MKDINNDILIDTNDYEEQKKLLSDEKKENQSIKKDIIKSFIFLLVIIIIIITAYLTIYIYKIYGNYNPTKTKDIDEATKEKQAKKDAKQVKKAKK